MSANAKRRHILPDWPPAGLTDAQVAYLTGSATDFAFAHGLVYRPPLGKSQTVIDTTSVIHAPFSLLPSPFPRELFAEAQSLQPISNELYARVAADHGFLEDVFLRQNVIEVDDFQRKLWEVYTSVRQEGIVQPRQLGLFRSDYLMHDASAAPGASTSGSGSVSANSGALTIKQVEFNTISSSFGPLCTVVSKLHRHLARTTGAYFGRLPSTKGKARDAQELLAHIPQNEALDTLSRGLADAHVTYLESRAAAAGPSDGSIPSEPVILFVVQPNERNAFDQRAIEYKLLEEHGIRCIRRTLAELASAVPDKSASLRVSTRELFVAAPALARPATSEEAASYSSTAADYLEVSVVYFRSGYAPTDYEGEDNAKAWDVRLLLERSAAIKCPSAALQLAGAKKVQQVLAEEGVLERFLLEKESGSGARYTAEDLARLRASWTELYPMDPRSSLGKQAYELAQREPHRFVLKPQREGGGNNIYKGDIPPALDAMEARDAKRGVDASIGVKEREGYILMSLIQPPSGVGNLLVKAGAGAGATAALAPDVVSELGIYGTCLFSSELEGGAQIIQNRAGGHLLRTKGRDSDEGGVAVGFSVIDSPYLV